MKGKNLIYLALGGVAAVIIARRIKEKSVVPVITEERRVVLLELGTEIGGLIPYRLTYSDGTTETGLVEYKEAQVFVQNAKRSGAEVKTNVEGITKLDGGAVVKPKA